MKEDDVKSREPEEESEASTSEDASLLESVERLMAGLAPDARPLDLADEGPLDARMLGELMQEVHSGSRHSSKQADSLVGEAIGRVHLEELVGRGGMGEVYRGRDQVLERHVAVKRIHPRKRLSREAKERFFREARLLSQLDHPNICQLYDLIETPDGEFLLLEYIAGDSLATRIAEGLAQDEALELALQLVSGIEAAHADGVIHRDLKPDNLIVDRQDRLKILDFGIATSGSSDVHEPAEAASNESEGGALTTMGQVLGTRLYMSPEQRHGGEVRPAADLYSVGLVLHEMFCGELPDVAAASDEVTLSPALDREMSEVIRRLLSADPHQRGTATDLRGALDRYRRRGQRRRRGIVTSVAAVVVVALVVSLYAALQPRRDELLLQPEQEGSVLIAPFDNATGSAELDWVDRGLQSLVSDALGSVDGIRVLSWNLIEENRLLRDLGGSGDLYDLTFEQAKRVAEVLGAEVLFVSRVRRDGSRYRIDYRSHNVLGSSSERSIVVGDVVESVEVLATRWASRLGQRSELVGLSFDLSEDPLVNRLYALGTHRFQRGRKSEGATLLFRAALEIDPEFLRARLALAECLDWVGQGEAARTEYVEVLRIAEEENNRPVLAAALEAHGELLWDLDADDEAALDSLWRAYALHEELGDEREQADVLQGVIRILGRRSASDDDVRAEIRQIRERAAEIYRRQKDPRSQVYGHYLEANWTHEDGDLETAKREASRAIELARSNGLVVAEGLSLMLYGRIVGGGEAAIAVNERAIELHEEVENYVGLTGALINLGWDLEGLGRFDEAEVRFRQTLDAARKAGLSGRVQLAKLHIGRVLNKQKRYAEALDTLQSIDDSTSTMPAFVHLQSARSFAGLERWAEAYRSLSQAKALLSPKWEESDEEELQRYRTEAGLEAETGSTLPISGGTW